MRIYRELRRPVRIVVRCNALGRERTFEGTYRLGFDGSTRRAPRLIFDLKSVSETLRRYLVLRLLWRIARHPRPIRATIADYLWRVTHPETPYQAYRYCVEMAAQLARGLDQKGITVAEFGVAGGNGLIALERHASEIEKATGVVIDVVGFDSGAGLPAPVDYRDLPYRWTGGYYPMDEDNLRARLTRATLRLGLVADTIPEFATECRFPLGALMIDLDYYSSTIAALRVLDLAPTLPRVPIYFDDLWPTTQFTGEWAAIHDYNSAHTARKIAQTWDLAHADESWRRDIFEFHNFEHPSYCRTLTRMDTFGHMPLR
jgi:hypothetical protein